MKILKSGFMKDKIILMLYNSGKGQKDTVFYQLQQELTKLNYNIRHPTSLEDMLDVVENNTRVVALIFDWDDFNIDLCEEVDNFNDNLPLFAFTGKHTINDIKISNLNIHRLNFFEYKLQEILYISQKIDLIIGEYFECIIPPLTRRLFDFVSKNKYTFCTPGHLGGGAFLKSPIGAIFYDFFGENIFRADISISVPELGSLLDHTSSHYDAEKFIAKVFGADRSYMVTNGTSTANKIVGMSIVSAGDTILMDRNCHKSLTHLLMITDVTPIYFKPTRNAYGILGGIPRSEFSEDVIKEKMKKAKVKKFPNYAVITNSTYDGLLYNTKYIKSTLNCKNIHFDSAWVPYTAFHHIYNDKAGLSESDITDKTIYETHSTHKLLAAFSQASMIHINGSYDATTFNEAYMMHTSTSPQYNMVASCEVAAAMMQGNSGHQLIKHSLQIAYNFRNAICQIASEATGWFFKVWQPDNIYDINCWPLKSSDTWHGFNNIDDNHMFLDPIKVTLILPGLEDNIMQDDGIPASIVSEYLNDNGIVVEKTGPYTLLFLFSIGIDRSHSLRLIKSLVDFKRAYDLNLKIKNIIPSLYAKHPEFYESMTIQELAKGIHNEIKAHQLPKLMYEAFEVLPEMRLTPYQAFQQVNKGAIKEVPLKKLINNICAQMVLPYPPGVPLILPGEAITKDSEAILNFLDMLVRIGVKYPGFETDIHGLQQKNGKYYARVVV